MDYKIQAFVGSVREIELEVDDAGALRNKLVGFRLDEIQIQATIRTEAEIEDFVAFLHQSIPCLR